MNNTELLSLDFGNLQDEGVAFMWVTNATESLARKFFTRFGYRIVDEIVWVKMTNKGNIVGTQGYYVQHSFEKRLIAIKGDAGKYFHKVKAKNLYMRKLRETRGNLEGFITLLKRQYRMLRIVTYFRETIILGRTGPQ